MLTFVFALSACVTQVEPARAPPAQQRVVGEGARQIVFQITSWGYRREYWSVSSSGDATLYMAARGSNLEDPLVMSSATISPEDFERIRIASLPAGRYLRVGIPCQTPMTDTPQGSITWVYPDGAEDEIYFNTGCPRSAESEVFFGSTRATDGLFHEVTNLR